MLQRLLSLSLRTHLFLMAFVLALPAFVLILRSGLQESRDSRTEGLEKARKLVYGIAAEQYNLTGDSEELLTILALLPEVRRHDVAGAKAILAAILKKTPQYGNIVITDSRGRVWASGLPMTESFSLADKRSFRNAVRTRHFSSGEYIVGKISGRPTIGYGYPIISDRGTVDGAILVNLNFGTVNGLLLHSGLPKGSTYTIIDHSGTIVSRSSGGEHFIGTRVRSDIFSRLRNGGEEESYFGPGTGGLDSINSYRKLKLQGEASPYLYILASIPLAETQEKAVRALLGNIALLTPFLLVTVVLVIRLGDYCFVSRIEELRKASLRLADGDLDARVPDVVEGGELGSLARTLNEMAEKLASRETALVRSEAELEDLYNNAPCGYHSLDRDGTFIRMNDTELARLGYRRDEIVGRMKFADVVTPEGLQKFERQFWLLKRQGWVRDLEFELVRKDGSTFPALLNATAMYDADGAFLMARSTTHDITERKRVEKALGELNRDLTRRVDEETERRLKQERLLARHARLAAIGEMIGAIAHQWRQPLATLGATVQSIRMAWDRGRLDDPFLQRAEADAQKQLYYMSDTIEDFRNFFRPEKVAETFDVMEKVQEVVLLVSPQFANSGVRLQVLDNSSAPLKLRGFPNEFKQSLLNLVSNSFDAIAEKWCAAGAAGVPPAEGLVTVAVADRGENAVIEVCDNGCGIPAEHADKVFEPYFTSKSEGKGTGIGLYMSKLIVEESMGGHLAFTSGPEGTVFRIELPRDFAPGGQDV